MPGARSVSLSLSSSGAGRVLGALSGNDRGAAPEAIQFAPPGRHVITARVNGRAGRVEVNVTPESAARLQASLERRLQDNVRPIVDFDHNELGPAAALPRRFFWDDEGGLMLEVDWTASGRAAVEGRDYSYFSPFVLIDNAGDIIGLDDQRPVGALVNDPAFRDIDRIAAANSAGEEQPDQDDMQNPDFSPLIQAGVLSAAQAREPDPVPSIAAAFAAALRKREDETKAREKAEADLATAQQAIEATRRREAEAAVERAVAAGAIPAKDEDARKFWADLIVEKGEPAVKQLEARHRAGDLTQDVIRPDAAQAATPDGQMAADMDRARKVAARATELMESNRNLTYTTAFQKARNELR